MKTTRTEKALLAVKRKRDIAPRQEDALYQEAMKAGKGQRYNEFFPLGSVVNPIVVGPELFERIVKDAKSKCRHSKGKWRDDIGRVLLWRDLFFFTPDPKAGK